MLSDVAAECKVSQVDTSASAALAVALAWAHLGELTRARGTHSEAAAMPCKDAAFVSVLDRSATLLSS